jgi:hypothetical protein
MMDMHARWIAGLTLLLAVGGPGGAGAADTMEVKTAAGQVLGTMLFCNDCKNPGGKGCFTGAEDGWLKGERCGQCLVDANHDTILRYPVDIHVVGKLVNGKGEPVKDRFVKLFLPNGWGVRTRTIEGGTFRLMLGATAERESKTPLIVDVGSRVDSVKDNDPYYAIFMMPIPHKPCAAKPAAEKPAK